MYTGTKKMILCYLVENSANFTDETKNQFTASYISNCLSISRSLTSHYLNELFKERLLIKINDRPVVFLYKKAFSNYNEIGNEYSFIDEFIPVISSNINDFSKVIGSNFSLRPVIKEIKKALNYPPYGLNMILSGKQGTGKKYITKSIFEYCLYNNFIPSNSKYMYISCNGYEDLQINEMFFNKNDGILIEEKNSFIVIDDLNINQYLFQSNITDFIDKKSNVKFIFLCETNLENTFIPRLLNRLLVNIDIPSLNERTVYEKENMILKFIIDESKNIDKEIKISDKFIEVMLADSYENRIDKLKKAVVLSITNAYLNEKEVLLNVSCVPNKENIQFSSLCKEKYYNLNEYFNHFLNKINEVILSTFDRIKNYYINNELSERELIQAIDVYNDYTIFKINKYHLEFQKIIKLVENLCTILKNKNNILFEKNYQNIIVNSLYAESIEYKDFVYFDDNYDIELTLIIETIKKENKEVYECIELFSRLLQNVYSKKVTKLLKIIMMINLKFIQNKAYDSKTNCILICHGYSTATSIASAANTLIGDDLFYPFDMPLDVDVDEIVIKIDEYLYERKFIENLLIIVDMGSLELIGDNIKNKYNINIGIINNVTTSMVLDVGMKLKNNIRLEEVLEESSLANVCKYKIINKRKKEKAIVFVSESGTFIAEKIKKLFYESIPNNTPLKLLSYDYYSFINEDRIKDLLDKYDIVFITGIINPKIENVKFINLGEIINLDAIPEMNEIFTIYMTNNEIEEFNSNLIKNFTLTNVIESLTILNPKNLLDSVEKSIKQLEISQNEKLNPKILIGLYVHVCCFVERAIKGQEVKTHVNLVNFEIENKEFIDNVQNSFDYLKNEYGIEIPTSEIAYIYDYLYLNREYDIKFDDE